MDYSFLNIDACARTYSWIKCSSTPFGSLKNRRISAEAKSKLEAALEHLVQETEIEIKDHTRDRYVDGMAVKVIARQPTPGLNEETFLSIALSDILFIALRADEQDYLGTAVTLEIAKKFEIPKIYLILNKILPKYAKKDVEKQMQKAFHVPPAATMFYSEEFADLGSKDIFILKYPNHDFTKAIEKIHGHLIED